MPGPNRFTEGLLEMADVVASDLARNGEIRVNLGDAGTGSGIGAGVPFWGIDGFLSRPADPTPAGACQQLFVNDGQTRYAIGSRDRRFLPYVPTVGEIVGTYPGLDTSGLDPGDRVIYTPNGVAVVLDRSSNAVTLVSPDGSRARLQDGEWSISVGGSSLTLTANSFDVTLANGASLRLNEALFDVSVPTTPQPSGIAVDASGIVLTAKNDPQSMHFDAFGFVTIGLTSGLIRPLTPSVENVNIGPGGGVTVPSPRVYAASA
jgi:hypothetical protein